MFYVFDVNYDRRTSGDSGTVLMIHFIIVVFLIQTTFDGLKVASLLADSPSAQILHHNSSINGRKTENKPNATNRTAPKKGITSGGSILLKQSADSAVLKNSSNELSSVLPRDSIFNSTARVEKRRDLLYKFTLIFAIFDPDCNYLS